MAGPDVTLQNPPPSPAHHQDARQPRDRAQEHLHAPGRPRPFQDTDGRHENAASAEPAKGDDAADPESLDPAACGADDRCSDAVGDCSNEPEDDECRQHASGLLGVCTRQFLSSVTAAEHRGSARPAIKCGRSVRRGLVSPQLAVAFQPRSSRIPDNHASHRAHSHKPRTARGQSAVPGCVATPTRPGRC